MRRLVAGMKAVGKADLKERDEIVERLRSRRRDLDEAIAKFNDAALDAWGKVDGCREAYNEAIGDANSWKAEVAGDIQEFIDGRSDKWRESDKGSAYEAWREAYEDETESVEIDQPEDLSLDEDDAAENLERLPEEVEA
jgi:hypothetical protein